MIGFLRINIINLFCCPQKHNNYKNDETTLKNLKDIKVKPINKEKQFKLTIYITKYKTIDLIVLNNPAPPPLNPPEKTDLVYQYLCPFKFVSPSKRLPYWV